MLGRALQETPSGLFVPQLPEAGLASSGKKSIFEKLPPKVARSLIVIALGVSGCRALPTFSVDATATPPPGQTETLPSILDNAINGLNIEVVDPINNLKSDQQKELAAANSLFIQADGSSNLTFSKKENDPDNPLKKGNLTEALSIALNKPIENINVNNVNPAFLPKIIKFGEEGKLIIQPIVYTNDDGQEQIVMFASGNGTDWGLVGLINQPFDVFSSPGNGVVVQGIDQMFIAFPRKGAVDFTGLLVSGGRNGAVFSEALYFKVDNNGKLQLVLRDENGTLSGPAEENTPFNLQKDGIFNTSFTDNPVPILAPDLTPTLIPTLTETPTPSVPIIEVDGLKIPDPKASNPELFDLTSPDSPIVQFAKAFGIKPEEVGNLIPQLLTGVDGKQFVVLTTGDLAATSNFDESGIPLLIAEQGENGEWVWNKATLKSLANHLGINMGVLVDPSNPKIMAVEGNEFNLGVATFAWSDFIKSPDSINFSWIDRQAQFAQSKDMKIRLNHLIFPSAMPNWFEQGVKDGSINKDQAINILKDTITAVVNHGKNIGITEWSVVNEPYVVPYRTNDAFYKAIGEDYIDIAFQTAREVGGPSAILIYNDSNNHASSGENGLTTSRTHQIVDRLKSKGLIDGVGLQMHLDGSNPPNKADVIKTMKSYGLPVYITEFDVDMSKVTGSNEERMVKQAKIVETMLQAAIESGICKSFTVWGIGDQFSWLKKSQGKPNADATLFDDNLNPKLDYFALLQVLSAASK